MPSLHKEICEICLNSDVLCSACNQKLDIGRITKIDIEVAKFLKSLEDKFKILKKAQILRVFLTKDQMIVVARKGDASKIIGKNGSIVKLLSKEFGKTVKVVEEGENITEFVNNFIYPACIEGVNIVYGKNGEIAKYKIRIPRQYLRKIDRNLLEEVIESVFEKPVEMIII